MPLRVYMYPAGQAGMALYSYKLANALAEKGLQVSQFVDDQYELNNLPAKFSKIRLLSSSNVSVRSQRHRILRMASILLAHFHNGYKFYCRVKRDRPKIVHVQSLFYLVDWLILCWLEKTKTKLILTVHDVLPHKFYTNHLRWLELIVLRHMYKKADRLIVHSKRNRDQLLANFSIDASKVIVIPHGEYSLPGIDREMSKDEACSKLGLQNSQRVILFFGYIRKTKGIDVLLRAFDRVAGKLSDVVLVIAGSVIQGESFSQERRIISRMKYGSQVKCFIRYIENEDVPVFFTPAEMVVLPYVEFYSQSGVLHLAQGFGKPVIVTEVGGLPEVVEDHETGLIVPAGDVESLAKAMSYLLKSESVRTEMGQQARQMAMQRFSWETIAKATIEKAYSV